MYEMIPHELRQLPQWVCWKSVPDETRAGKIKKVPINPRTGGQAQSNNHETWTTFEAAVAAAANFSGIGFMFGNGLFGVDIDNVEDAIEDFRNGEDQNIISEFIHTLQSYAEYSVSGKGVHIICRGTLPPTGRRKKNVEMYSEGRFFIMTGNLAAEYMDIRDCTEDIKPLHEKYIGGGFNPQVAFPTTSQALDLIVHADSGASPTLNFNGKGAKNVYQFTGKAAKWSAGQHVVVEYDGTNFFVCSAGGGTDLPAVISAGETIIKQWLGTKGYSKSAGWSGWYTITGLTFTVGITGTYRIKLFVSNYYYVSLRFWKNNATQVGTTVTYSNSGNNATILQDIPLNAGDAVVVQLSSLTSAGSPGLNFSEITAKILADDIQNLLNSALLLTVS